MSVSVQATDALHTLLASRVAVGLGALWILLNIAIAIAMYRNAFAADRREAELDATMEERTLAEYSARALPEQEARNDAHR